MWNSRVGRAGKWLLMAAAVCTLHSASVVSARVTARRTTVVVGRGVSAGAYYAPRQSYGAARVTSTVVRGGRGRSRGLLSDAGDAVHDAPYTAADNLQLTAQPVARGELSNHQQADAADSNKLVVIVKKTGGRRGLLQEVVEVTPRPADLSASSNVTANMTGNVTAVMCPLDIEGSMGQALDLKVEECNNTAVDSAVYCQACVKPLQMMLAKAAYNFIFDAMKNSTVEEEEAEVSVLDSPEVHAACGLAILDALQTRGLVVTSEMEAMVDACGAPNATADVCVSADSTAEEMDALVEECAAVLAAEDPTASEYCGRCYWPLMSFALNADLSDGFWCFVRDFSDKYRAIQDLAFDSDSDVVPVMRDKNEGEMDDDDSDDMDDMDSDTDSDSSMAPTLAEWEAELTGRMVLDPSFIDCVFKLQSKFHSANISVGQDPRVTPLRAQCWRTENLPPPNTVLEPATRAKVDATVCHDDSDSASGSDWS